MMGKPLLRITDGTATGTINLLAGTRKNGGFKLVSWIPATPEPKGGGVWRESPFAPGRQLVFREFGNVIDSFELVATGGSQDLTIRDTQELRRLLQKAVDYRVSGWTSEPVRIEARASCETNTRYALIEDYRTPHDGNPYADPFATQAIIGSFDLILEHAIWQHTAPGVGECIPISAGQTFCWPNYLLFAGGTDEVDCGSDAGLDNLTAGANGFTAEAWIRADGYGGGGAGRIFNKRNGGAGWIFHVDSADGIVINIDAVTTDARSEIGLDEFTADGLWHHVAFTYDDTGDRKIYIWVDGIAVTSYVLQQAAVDALLTDAADDLFIGNRPIGDVGFDGGIGWCRLSDTLLYTAGVDFEPPPRCKLPDIHPSDTVALWIYEGRGATAQNLEGDANRDGTITGAAWTCGCETLYGCSDDAADCACTPSYLRFDGADDKVNCGTDATIDNLPIGANGFTASAWVREIGGGGTPRWIFEKSDAATGAGWEMRLDRPAPLFVNKLIANVYAAVTNADSQTYDFPTDGLWHLVTMQYDDGGDRKIYLWVDGIAVSYDAQIAAVGAFDVDATENLFIGNDKPNDSAWAGDIGWCWLSDFERYTNGVDFTPPARCTIPEPDSDTVGIWIYEGFGFVTWNRVPGAGITSVGIVDGPTWGCDCADTADCICDNCAVPDSVYLTNKHTRSQITHIYAEQGGNWTGNLQNVFPAPVKLFWDSPAATDAVYFICDSDIKNSCPYDSLVFDIITAQGDLTSVIWEYWSGAAFATLTVQDNTNADGLATGDPFDTTGVKSVHWERPSDWASVNLLTEFGGTAPDITGWVVRARVATIGGTPTSPVIANNKVYTISWPYIEIDDEDVLGDIAARLRIQLRNQSDKDGELTPPVLYFNNALLGLRSLSRGENFSAYINLINNADFDHNPENMTVSYLAVSLVVSPLFPAGAYALYDPGGVETLGTSYILAVIENSLSFEYRGTYRAFVRGYQVSGTLGDITMRLGISIGTISDPVYTQIVSFSGNLSAFEVVDLGIVTINPELLVSDEIGTVVLRLELGNSSAGPLPDAYLSEIILMPVDEWSGEFANNLQIVGDRDDVLRLGQYLDIDSVHNPKLDIRALVKNTPDDAFVANYKPISSGAMMLQSNANQRLWMLLRRWDTTPFGDRHYEAQHEISNSIHYSEMVFRYLSMRGAR